MMLEEDLGVRRKTSEGRESENAPGWAPQAYESANQFTTNRKSEPWVLPFRSLSSSRVVGYAHARRHRRVGLWVVSSSHRRGVRWVVGLQRWGVKGASACLTRSSLAARALRRTSWLLLARAFWEGRSRAGEVLAFFFGGSETSTSARFPPVDCSARGEWVSQCR